MRNINTLMNLHGRTALITGATGNIGQELALTLAELGANIILVDLPSSKFSIIENKLLRKYDISVKNIPCDLENEKSRQKLIDQINKEEENLNILIHNAAFVGESNLKGWVSDFENQDLDSWKRAFEVNLTSVFHLTKGLTKKLRESQSSSIINVSSIYGLNGPDLSLYEGTKMGNPAAYSASKGGLIQLTRWLATTLAPDIRVNCISPGGVWRNQPKKFVERYEARTPLKKMASEEDLKGVTAFLASDMSSYVTGQNILIDGGWTSW
jgi:NAD(P)-dependent dehydrogenase (short-subunit alcohol dehydrogenase family)